MVLNPWSARLCRYRVDLLDLQRAEVPGGVREEKDGLSRHSIHQIAVVAADLQPIFHV